MDRNPAWQLNGGGCVPYSVGAWNIEPSEDEGLDVLHGLRLVTGLMIIADEMKKAMHCEMRQVVSKRLTLRMRLAFRRFVGDHDVAEQTRPATAGLSGSGREGEHVGRGILMAPRAVEPAHGGIIGQHDGDLAILDGHDG